MQNNAKNAREDLHTFAKDIQALRVAMLDGVGDERAYDYARKQLALAVAAYVRYVVRD